MASYSLDVETFINAVKTQPAIWDVNCDDHKYKNRKQEAWFDIARTFIDDFGTMSAMEQSDVYHKLQGKWRNIRDSYVRHLKKVQHGKSGYRYAQNLTFLDMVYNKNSSQSDSDGDENKSGDCSDNEEEKKHRAKRPRAQVLNDSNSFWQSDTEETPSTIDNLKRRRIGKHATAAVEFVETPFMEQSCNYPTEDEDRSFFESLLPAVREFNIDQKLEFRSQVISLIKIIRSNKPARRQFKLDPSTGEFDS